MAMYICSSNGPCDECRKQCAKINSYNAGLDGQIVREQVQLERERRDREQQQQQQEREARERQDRIDRFRTQTAQSSQFVTVDAFGNTVLRTVVATPSLSLYGTTNHTTFVPFGQMYGVPVPFVLPNYVDMQRARLAQRDPLLPLYR